MVYEPVDAIEVYAWGRQVGPSRKVQHRPCTRSLTRHLGVAQVLNLTR